MDFQSLWTLHSQTEKKGYIPPGTTIKTSTQFFTDEVCGIAARIPSLPLSQGPLHLYQNVPFLSMISIAGIVDFPFGHLLRSIPTLPEIMLDREQ